MFSPQPETLQLVLRDGSSCEYTPDFKAVFVGSELTYIEVKPKDLALEVQKYNLENPIKKI